MPSALLQDDEEPVKRTLEQKEAKFETWAMIMWFFLTDLWLVIVAIMIMVEIVGNDDTYLSPSGWSIVVLLTSHVILLVWIIIFFLGACQRPSLKDVTNTSYSDYLTWITTGSVCYVIFVVINTISNLVYLGRFDAAAPRATSAFDTADSARTWLFSVMLLPFTMALGAVVFHSVSTWKYWALVWSCSDQSIFKNPFFVHRRVRFHWVSGKKS
jgi:hypothetical protein